MVIQLLTRNAAPSGFGTKFFLILQHIGAD